MIRYSLRCAAGHAFDAWFRSSAAFDTQRAAGRVACAVCGTAEVEKAPMAPSLKAARPASAESRPDRSPSDSSGPEQTGPDLARPDLTRPDLTRPDLMRPASPAEAALGELRRRIEREADYVGPDFAAEARRIHAGEAEKRSIWGEASRDEARALDDEGIPVAPVPWMRRSDG